ncbi:MAG: c-type cytochrome [Bacteroidia bacterium]|jgi:mono/diheme cytochrome c family protein
MKAKLKLTCSIFFIIAFTLYSCSARRIEKDMTTSNSDNTQLEKGRIIFKTNCQKCHPNGESGVGPEINTIRIPGILIRARVRSRAFLLWTGRMPQFSHKEISRKDMDALVVFVKELRHKK